MFVFGRIHRAWLILTPDQELRKIDRFQTGVVETVAVKALRNHSEPQFSTAWPQRIQSKAVNSAQFQQASTSRQNWFGTRGSEVRILSPRPTLESTTYNTSPGTEKYGPRGHFWQVFFSGCHYATKQSEV
jgi:hypothetical protein